MSKIIKGIFVLMFAVALAGVAGVKDAGAQYEMPRDTCISVSIPIDSTLTPDKICKHLSYAGCDKVVGTPNYDFYKNPDCTGTSIKGVSSSTADSCFGTYKNTAARGSMILNSGTISCKGIEWSHRHAPEGVQTDIEYSVMNIVNYILGFIIIVATLIVIYGGVKYLTASGNEDAVEEAKKTISYGVIGMVIAGLAYGMVIVISTVILRG